MYLHLHTHIMNISVYMYIYTHIAAHTTKHTHTHKRIRVINVSSHMCMAVVDWHIKDTRALPTAPFLLQTQQRTSITQTDTHTNKKHTHTPIHTHQ